MTTNSRINDHKGFQSRSQYWVFIPWISPHTFKRVALPVRKEFCPFPGLWSRTVLVADSLPRVARSHCLMLFYRAFAHGPLTRGYSDLSPFRELTVEGFWNYSKIYPEIHLYLIANQRPGRTPFRVGGEDKIKQQSNEWTAPQSCKRWEKTTNNITALSPSIPVIGMFATQNINNQQNTMQTVAMEFL